MVLFWNGPFLGFLGLYSPKYCSILLKWSEVVPNKTNTVFQKPFKILNFGSKGTHPRFTVLVDFGAHFPARKPKILLKTRISAKTTYRPTSLGISNNVSLRSQKNHIILVKLSKKIFLEGRGERGGRLGLNCPLVPVIKVLINPHLAYNTTIHLDTKFQLLGICCSWLHPKETITFFGFRTQLGPFWGVWGQYL